MFKKLTNKDISAAIDKLIAYLGVKEEIPSSDFLKLLRDKNAQGCVQEIAIRLGLPIRINLSYVGKDFRADNTNVFHTSAIAQTDWRGRGIESITAQVSIPPNLPMFGSSGLQGYPIQVRISESCHEHPETFVAIMAHELSHVLLASLWLPEKDSELHTDLVPIILGFREIVRRGRKIVQSTISGDTTTTQTTTYGYLTDSQHDFVCRYVIDILKTYQSKKKSFNRIGEEIISQASHSHKIFGKVSRIP